MRSSHYSHVLHRFGNNHSISPTVILGFIVGRKQSWKLIYFLFSRGVKCQLECKLDYQKYGMLCVKTDIIYTNIYTYILTHMYIKLHK